MENKGMRWLAGLPGGVASLPCWLAGLCFMGLLPEAAQAAEYYVSTTGNNASNGLSPDTALATIRAGVDRAQPGDTVWVLPGTYAQALNVWEKNGTADAWITISGLAGQPRPVLDLADIPGGTLWVGGAPSKGSSYVHIRRLAVANSPTAHGLGAANVHHLKIEDSEFYGNHRNGIYIGPPTEAGAPPNSHVSIIGNQVHHNVLMNQNGQNANTAGDWTQAIGLFSTTDSEILNNTVWENWGEGIDVVGRNLESGRTLIKGNRVFDSWSVQIYVDHSRDNTIEGNLTWSSLATFRHPVDGYAKGLAVGDEGGDPNLVSSGNIFRNNVVVGAGQGFRYADYSAGLRLGLRNTQVVNNTFVDFNSAGIRIDAAANGFHSGNLIANNIFMAPTTAGLVAAQVPDTSGSTFHNNLWSGPSWGRINGMGDVLADPLFIGCDGDPRSALCFQPGAASPARHAGMALAGVNVDYAGTARPANPAIGALEFVPGTSTTTLSLGVASIRTDQTALAVATVAGNQANMPSGSVDFLLNGVPVGSAALAGSAGDASAVFALTGLAPGRYTLTAVYAGDDRLAGSTSAPVMLQVMADQFEPLAVPALGPLALLALSLGIAGIGYAKHRRGRRGIA